MHYFCFVLFHSKSDVKYHRWIPAVMMSNYTSNIRAANISHFLSLLEKIIMIKCKILPTPSWIYSHLPPRHGAVTVSRASFLREQPPDKARLVPAQRPLQTRPVSPVAGSVAYESSKRGRDRPRRKSEQEEGSGPRGGPGQILADPFGGKTKFHGLAATA